MQSDSLRTGWLGLVRLTSARYAKAMTAIFGIGIVLTLGGLAGLLWCIRRAMWIKSAQLDDDAARAELNKLIFGHMASIGGAFMGIGVIVMGLLLG